MKRTILVLIVGAILGLTGCGGGDTKTVTVADTTAEQSATTAETTTTNQGTIIDGVIGGAARTDGSLTIKATNIKGVTGRLPSHDFAEEPNIVPATGTKFVTVDVTVTNSGSQPMIPFCIGQQTTLIDRENRNFSMDGRTSSLAVNERLCEEIQPGVSASYTLLYQVPESAYATHLAVWDSDDADDPWGHESWIRFAR